jgi:hypothetical protein
MRFLIETKLPEIKQLNIVVLISLTDIQILTVRSVKGDEKVPFSVDPEKLPDSVHTQAAKMGQPIIANCSEQYCKQATFVRK